MGRLEEEMNLGPSEPSGQALIILAGVLGVVSFHVSLDAVFLICEC
jgi:hypothetical protein